MALLEKMASRASPSRPIPGSVPFVLFSPLETAEQNGAQKKQRRACLQSMTGVKLRCQDVGKGYSPSFSLLTGGRKQKQANMLKTQCRKAKKYSLATLQRKLGVHTGPCKEQELFPRNRALLVSKHSSSSQSQQVRHAAQVLVR